MAEGGCILHMLQPHSFYVVVDAMLLLQYSAFLQDSSTQTLRARIGSITVMAAPYTNLEKEEEDVLRPCTSMLQSICIISAHVVPWRNRCRADCMAASSSTSTTSANTSWGQAW